MHAADKASAIAEKPSLHAEIISALSPRRWLIGGTFLSNRWVVRTDDPSIKRALPVAFDFAIPLTGWPDLRRLSDPEFELDLITAKLLVYYSLEPRPLGWYSSAVSAEIEHRSFATFLRWRIDRGIASNSQLSAAWHREYVTSLRKNGREGLLRVERRAEQLVEAVNEGKLEWPCERISKNITVSKNTEVANLLGLGSRQITPAAAGVIEPFVQSRGMRYPRYGRQASGETIAQNTAIILLTPWLHLWHLRRFLKHDPIGYCAYRSKRAIAVSVKGWAKTPERTEDAPAYQTSWLINAALMLILDDVSDRIVHLASHLGNPDALETTSRLLAEINQDLLRLGFPPALDKYIARASEMAEAEATDLRNLIVVLVPVASAIVIATWSARRYKEIDSLKEGCVEEDDDGETWLHCLIEKNLRAADRVPVPRSVQVAVKLLEKLRAATNTWSDPPWLFDFTCPLSRQHVDFRLREALNRFAAWAKVPPLPDGSFWVFTPQQFRKFFSIAYNWRYFFPNLAALSYHLRHFNPDTTRGYVAMKANEVLRLHDERGAMAASGSPTRSVALSALERERDVEGGRVRFVEEIFRSTALEERQLAGYGGTTLMADLDKFVGEFQAQTQISSADDPEDSFNAMIVAFSKGKSLRMHPEGHSLCKCTSEKLDLVVARCLELKSIVEGADPVAALGPDYAYAEDVVCWKCPHGVQVEELIPQWDRAERAATDALVNATPDQREVVSKRLGKIRELRGRLPW